MTPGSQGGASGGPEPPADGTATGETFADCPNCGHPRADRYCARCGQNDRDYIRSLPLMLGEFVRETLELDSRVLRTVKLMVLRPGELSAEFSRNRRASYSSPIRFYLFVSLVFFFVLSVTTDFRPPAERWGEADVELDRASEGADVEVLKAMLPAEQRRKIDEILAHPGRPYLKIVIYESAKALAGAGEGFVLDGFDRFLAVQVIDVMHEPVLAVERLVDNLPIAMFVTLPVYALLLAVFYRRRRRFYVEHLVFGIHVHTVAFAVFTVLMLLPEAPAADAVGSLLTLGLLGYYYIALRRYYGDGFFLTAVKWSLSMVAYAVLLVPGFVLALFVTLYSM